MSSPQIERLRSLQAYYALTTAGDPRARRLRDRIAQENDRLAIKIARRMMAVCSEDLEDLCQLARIGLLKAIERFDPRKGAAFSSFAVPYIRGEILHYLRDHWSLLKIPRRWLETFEQVERIQRKFAANGRTLEAPLIAAALGISAERWSEIATAFQIKSVGLDEVLHLTDEVDDDRRELREAAIARVASLPNPMRICVLERLLGKLKDEAIAKQQGLSVIEVRQIIDAGLQRLRVGQLEVMEA
jgi:RNA polymerase sigma-B factor